MQSRQFPVGTNLIIMPSIPVDILREILEHVSRADLATLCRVNRICCSFSRDVLYRNITIRDSHVRDSRVCDSRVTRTLAQSTDLAKRVRSFYSHSSHPTQELSVALKNMSSLRHLDLLQVHDTTILDGCTFQLVSFGCPFSYSEPLRKFLTSQPSLTYVEFFSGLEEPVSFEQTLLPNLTRVAASYEWFHILVPGRPVRSIDTHFPYPPVIAEHFDPSFFALSTGPLLKLRIPILRLYPKSPSLFISTFPFLTHLMLYSYILRPFDERTSVRKTPFY
jgi:hypothetical protein